jgi:ElaB/YqjD/DUF883 family membrane-anchored ribosome-binding protein
MKETKLMQTSVVEEPATVEHAAREVSKLRTMVNDAMEEGVRSASQAIRHGRDAAEDALEDVKHTVKRRPIQAIGLAFAAGVFAGGLLTWIGSRRR